MVDLESNTTVFPGTPLPMPSQQQLWWAYPNSKDTHTHKQGKDVRNRNLWQVHVHRKAVFVHNCQAKQLVFWTIVNKDSLLVYVLSSKLLDGEASVMFIISLETFFNHKQPFSPELPYSMSPATFSRLLSLFLIFFPHIFIRLKSIKLVLFQA